MSKRSKVNKLSSYNQDLTNDNNELVAIDYCIAQLIQEFESSVKSDNVGGTVDKLGDLAETKKLSNDGDISAAVSNISSEIAELNREIQEEEEAARRRAAAAAEAAAKKLK